jgi:hypothetical protein
VIEWYDGERSLDSAIADAIELFADERGQYWSEFEESRDLADEIARILFSSALDPFPEDGAEASEPIDPALPERLAELGGGEQPIQERMQLLLAWRMLPRTEKMAERALDLVRGMFTRRPAAVTVKYVRRLVRCYVMGLFPETVIVCRAVVEKSIEDVFEHAGVPVPATERGESSLKTKIEATRRLGLLPDEVVDGAHKVRLRGNVAVHNDPEAVAEVKETVMLTYSVLEAVYE